MSAEDRPVRESGLSQEHPERLDEQPRGGPSGGATVARLSVNINARTEAALVEMCSREGISMTEALRRLAGYGEVVYRAALEGRSVVLRGPGGDEGVVLLDPPTGRWGAMSARHADTLAGLGPAGGATPSRSCTDPPRYASMSRASICSTRRRSGRAISSAITRGADQHGAHGYEVEPAVDEGQPLTSVRTVGLLGQPAVSGHRGGGHRAGR